MENGARVPGMVRSQRVVSCSRGSGGSRSESAGHASRVREDLYRPRSGALPRTPIQCNAAARAIRANDGVIRRRRVPARALLRGNIRGDARSFSLRQQSEPPAHERRDGQTHVLQYRAIFHSGRVARALVTGERSQWAAADRSCVDAPDAFAVAAAGITTGPPSTKRPNAVANARRSGQSVYS